MIWTLLLFYISLAKAQEGHSCPPQINLPDFHYSCNQASDCGIAGDNCRSCNEPIVINKKFLKEYIERDLLLRQKYECSVACERCPTDTIKIYCVDKKCSLQAPPEPVAQKRKKKKPAELEDSDDSAAIEKEDVY